MKNILKLTLLISAIAMIAVGCRTESDSSLINTWRVERLELSDITFTGGINAMQQAGIRAMLTALINEYINPELAGTTFEFRENGNLIVTDPDDNIHTGSYTESGSTLTITGYFEAAVSGTFSISGNTMHWDINPIGSLLVDNFEDMGVSNIVFRFVFRRV